MAFWAIPAAWNYSHQFAFLDSTNVLLPRMGTASSGGHRQTRYQKAHLLSWRPTLVETRRLKEAHGSSGTFHVERPHLPGPAYVQCGLDVVVLPSELDELGTWWPTSHASSPRCTPRMTPAILRPLHGEHVPA